MIRHILCNSSPSLSPPPPSSPPRPKSTSFRPPPENLSFLAKSNYWQKIPSITQALSSTLLSIALSLGLFYASPSDVISLELNSTQEALKCDEGKVYDKLPAQVATNEEIVEDAWQIVNDSFLDTGRRHWSHDIWLKKKDDVLCSPIQARSRAHDIIRRMLASLGDPYTRFLSPNEGFVS